MLALYRKEGINGPLARELHYARLTRAEIVRKSHLTNTALTFRSRQFDILLCVKRGAPMARTIHCTVIEVPAMQDTFGYQPRGFNDLVPWADPYIAALIEKLRHADPDAEDAEDNHADDTVAETDEDRWLAEAAAELPPPLDNDEPRREQSWEADWSRRHRRGW